MTGAVVSRHPRLAIRDATKTATKGTHLGHGGRHDENPHGR